jgi:hypothetical protein
MKLDEQALRRPGFAGGVPVVLGDGREWTLPPGLVTFDPAEAGVGRALTPAEVDFLFGAGPETPFGVVETLLRLAARLLTVNYDLSTAHLSRLLPWDDADVANGEMWAEVLRAAGGRRERTWYDWLRVTFAANRVGAGGMDVGEAAAVANLLVASGRAYPAREWVQDAIDKHEAAAIEGML